MGMIRSLHEDNSGGIFPLLIASPDSFLIAESRIPHRIGIIGIKSSQMESNGLYKKV